MDTQKSEPLLSPASSSKSVRFRLDVENICDNEIGEISGESCPDGFEPSQGACSSTAGEYSQIDGKNRPVKGILRNPDDIGTIGKRRLWELCRSPAVWFQSFLFVGIFVFLCIILLPAVAFSAYKSGWVTGEGKGWKVEMGWRSGCVAGFDSVRFTGVRGGGGISLWSLDESKTSCREDMVTSLAESSAMWRYGTAIPVFFVLALASPLFLCVVVPFGCKIFSSRFLRNHPETEAGELLGEACSLFMILATKAIYVGFGIAVIYVSRLFVSEAKRELCEATRRVIDVTCGGAAICNSVRDLDSCMEKCSVMGGVVRCQGFLLPCEVQDELITCTGEGCLCDLSGGWAFAFAVTGGVLLILAGACLGLPLCWSNDDEEDSEV